MDSEGVVDVPVNFNKLLDDNSDSEQEISDDVTFNFETKLVCWDDSDNDTTHLDDDITSDKKPIKIDYEFDISDDESD